MELQPIPLAITQASAYITVYAPRVTVSKYLQILKNDEKNLIRLLSNNEVDLRRDTGVPNSVIRTWQISFSQIKDKHTAAADLLSRMCMLDRQGIPEFLICEDGKPSLDFEEAIGLLIQFSFVLEGKGKKVFAIHRLVQLATKKWIETNGEVERFQKEALRLVWLKYPTGNHENWMTCEALEPHAQVVLNYIYDSKDCKLQQSRILHNGACYALKQGRFKISDEMVCLGSDDPNTLASLSLLASTYRDQGRRTEAEKLELQILKTKKKVLGVEHPSTLASMNNLALTYWNQGRWKEAEELEVQVLEIRKRVLGVEHPDTLQSMNNLASTYWDQGRWKEAEELEVQVLEMSKRVLGVEHPDTLVSIGNLALTYWNQGRRKEAEKLNVQVLETRKRVSGVEHPDTLISMNNLAYTYHSQDRHSEAIELMEKAVELGEKNLGPNHPDTIASINALAKWKDT